MSGKTILLLQIVYGADLKRLQAVAERLGDKLQAIDIGDLSTEKGQARLVANLTPLAQDAVKLADFLNERSEDPGISPFAQDMLKKTAGNVRNKAQDLIDAANAALADPELAPKLGIAMKDLAREVAAANKLATEYEPDAPVATKLMKLMPLLDKAQQKVEDMPTVVKKNPKEYERAEKEAKGAVQDIVKSLKPNPKQKKDLDRVENNLNDQIVAARKALQQPNNPLAEKELNRATEDLIDALNNLKKSYPDKKHADADEKNEIQLALDNLKKSFGPAVYSKPADKEQDAYERLKDNLDKLRDAAQAEDPKMMNNKARMAAQAAKDLAQAMRDPERLKSLPIAQRQAKEAAAKDIENQLPKVIKAAGNLIKDPKSEPKVEDLMDAIRGLKRVADRPNRPKDDRDLRDNFNDILAGLEKVKDKIQKGDPKAAEEAMSEIATALANLRRAGDRLKEKNGNPSTIEKPLSELEKIFEKIRNKAVPAAQGNVADQKAINDAVPQIKKAWNDLNAATRATDIAPLEDFEDRIDDVVLAAASKEPSRLPPAFKQLVQNLNDLGVHLDSIPDNPKAKQIAKDVLDNQIKPMMRDYATKAKEVAEDRAPPEELEDIANRIKAPLAQIKKALNPQSKNRDPEIAAGEVKKGVQDLRDAVKRGDPDEIINAIKKLKDAMDKYNDVIADVAKTMPDPRKRALLEQDAKEIKELTGDLRHVNPDDKHALASLLDAIPERINNWFDTFGNTVGDDARKAYAKANNLLITLGNLNDDDMDLGDLLGTAGKLNNLLRGLIGDTACLARQLGANEKNLTPAAIAALEMDEYITQLESYSLGKSAAPTPISSRTTTPSVLPSLVPPASYQVTADEVFETISLSQARTFDQVLAAVATEMHHAAKNMSKEADHVATELAKLAKAARGGSKQDMLVSAKAASAFILAFCKQMDDLAKRIPGRNLAEKKEQDNLMRYQQTLKNYATQLKILSSVKAASIESSRDTDATLTTLTRNLGDVVNASLQSMATTRDVIFGGKV
eukprot:TRINITY_DN3558_c0_g2_i1.p1 TRINITY_DN3558_c0_g2~~TRINITY_DN3558_c0_g2_i1.p1  ORF type:complete len:1096 (+),score=291.67 TRINITY_DN3558_c0_g2_i1:234-3290(+)